MPAPICQLLSWTTVLFKLPNSKIKNVFILLCVCVFFKCYLCERLNFLSGADEICDKILEFTQCHPYYTQQLASQVWEIGKQGVVVDDVVNAAIVRLLEFHDLNFERIWLNFNNTDKRILQWLSKGNKPYALMGVAQSTISSSLKRMLRDGYLIKPAEYELEDPFFRNWILQQ